MISLSSKVKDLAKNVKIQEAVNVLLREPNWEKAVEEVFEDRQAGLKGPLMAAVLTLMSATGASSAAELVDAVKDYTKKEQASPQNTYTYKQDMETVKKVLPGIGPLEEAALALEMRVPKKDDTAKRKSFSKFLKALSNKVNSGVGKVLQEVRHNPRLNPRTDEEIAKMIMDAFKEKVSESRHRDSLRAYLGQVDREFEDVNKAVYNDVVLRVRRDRC